MTRVAPPPLDRPAGGLPSVGGGGLDGGGLDLGATPSDGSVTRSAAPAGLPWAAVSHTVLRPPPEGRPAAAQLPGSSVAGSDSALRRKLFPAPEDDLPPLTDCLVEHFRVEERIGHGGMGSVFRAVDERLQRDVALKVLSPAHSRDRASVLRFRNEARAAARLDHANIARVFTVGEDRGLHFIAFEFVSGKTVRDLLADRGPLPTAEAVSIARQVAAALRHCAAAGVVHRDVKPSNVIVTAAGKVKLVDLGLARKDATDSVGDLTVAGTTLGTFDYIAPEQAKDPRSADVRSDIYSLGCTLFHMLVGRPPYPEGTVLQKLLDHQNRVTPDPRALNGRVPVELSELCRRMMASDPRERPQSPDALLAAFDGLPGFTRRGRARRAGTSTLAAFGTCALAATLALFAWVRWPADTTAAAYVTAAPDTIAPPVPVPVPPAPVVAAIPDADAPDLAGPPPAPEEDGGVVARSNRPVTVAAPAPAPFVVTAADGTNPRSFGGQDAFGEAVEEASRGEVVTVNADGLAGVLERAVRLTGKDLTVRAGRKSTGEAFRPLLKAYQVGNAPQTLFHLSGGATLTLEGLAVDFQLNEKTDGWTVFSLGGADRLTLRDCTVTLNGDEDRADGNALFLVRGYRPAPSDLVDLTDGELKDRAAAGAFTLQAERCLLRGQGDLVRVEPDRPGTLEFVHTAAAVQAAAVKMTGAEADSPAPGSDGGTVYLRLEQSTLLFGQAALDLRWKAMQDDRPPLPLAVLASDCLFVNAGDGVLVRTRGGADVGEFLARLEWQGTGTNRYLLDRFWVASGITTAIVNPADTFEDWEALAEAPGSPVSEMAARHRGVSLEPDYRGRFPSEITRADVIPRPAPLASDGEEPAPVRPAVAERPTGADAARLPPGGPPATP